MPMLTPPKGRSHKKKTKRMISTPDTLSSSMELSPKKLNMNAFSSESFVTEYDTDIAAKECMVKMDKANKGGRKKKNGKKN